MKPWAVIPVKPQGRAKSRLSGLLSLAERQAFARDMLRFNLQILGSLSNLQGTIIISRDAALLQVAQAYPNTITLYEDGPPTLNDALEKARRLLAKWRAPGMLVLPADLPLITAADVQAILEAGRNRPCMVIAPDRHRLGTNALLLHLSYTLAFQFGERSFQRHVQAAQKQDIDVVFCESKRLAHDIDSPEDWAIYQKYRTVSVVLQGK